MAKDSLQPSGGLRTPHLLINPFGSTVRGLATCLYGNSPSAGMEGIMDGRRKGGRASAEGKSGGTILVQTLEVCRKVMLLLKQNKLCVHFLSQISFYLLVLCC